MVIILYVFLFKAPLLHFSTFTCSVLSATYLCLQLYYFLCMDIGSIGISLVRCFVNKLISV